MKRYVYSTAMSVSCCCCGVALKVTLNSAYISYSALALPGSLALEVSLASRHSRGLRSSNLQ
jgi:hypothetical protein